MVVDFKFVSSETKMPTISRVHPRSTKQIPVRNAPRSIIGLLLPYRDVERSAMAPTTGCMISPDKGPAIHTKLVFDFVRPNCSRYGVP